MNKSSSPYCKVSPEICVIIPTYNNAGTIGKVVEDVLHYSDNVIVVNDGSTDDTLSVLSGYGEKITLISYPDNCGKGHALGKGMKVALSKGFRYAVTLDSDGQHYAEDILHFEEKIKNHPDALLVGSRKMDQPNMPQKNKFANRFSNFWFAVQTAHRLPDTQTGYRLYPLQKMGKIRLFTKRYEAELELLVRCAWRGTAIIPIPINVFYSAKEERVTHFRPKQDFIRISILNTFFCFAAVIYGYPSMFYHYITSKLSAR